jgi:Kelch motif
LIRHEEDVPVRRGGRLALALPLLAFVAAIVALATAGSKDSSQSTSAATASSPTPAAPESSRAGSAVRTGPLHVRAQRLGELASAVQDSAVAPVGVGSLALLGGIDAGQSSTAAITVVETGSAHAAGTLPEPQHDAQAATLGGQVYVFGGGVVSSYDHILHYDPATHQVSTAGTLPSAASDVAVTAIGDTAYVVGGYDGVHPLDTILAWRPGKAPRAIGHLPDGLRYAAVAAVGGKVIIAGGSAGPSESLSDAIYSFDPASGALRRIGHLPVPLTHASAASIDGQVLVVGGRRQLDGDQTSTILDIDPRTGRVHRAGRLPVALSDAAVAAIGGHVVVAGGQSPAGPQGSIVELVSTAR